MPSKSKPAADALIEKKRTYLLATGFKTDSLDYRKAGLLWESEHSLNDQARVAATKLLLQLDGHLKPDTPQDDDKPKDADRLLAEAMLRFGRIQAKPTKILDANHHIVDAQR